MTYLYIFEINPVRRKSPISIFGVDFLFLFEISKFVIGGDSKGFFFH